MRIATALLKGMSNLFGNSVHFIICINGFHLVAVIFEDRRGLLVELFKTSDQLLSGIITTLHQWFARYIIFSFNFWRVEVNIIRATA